MFGKGLRHLVNVCQTCEHFTNMCSFSQTFRKCVTHFAMYGQKERVLAKVQSLLTLTEPNNLHSNNAIIHIFCTPDTKQ